MWGLRQDFLSQSNILKLTLKTCQKLFSSAAGPPGNHWTGSVRQLDHVSGLIGGALLWGWEIQICQEVMMFR